MVIILKPNCNQQRLHVLLSWLRGMGLEIHEIVGESRRLLGLVGDTASLDAALIAAFDVVADVKRIQEPYKKVNRKLHPLDTVVPLSGTRIGGGELTLIAGPCSVESEAQLNSIAEAVKRSGATLLRGGAFKPRTSPYAFQGKGEEALRLISLAKAATGLPIIVENMEISHLPLFDDVDCIQVGARNMQNYILLKALGQQNKPVLLKRGLSATFEEWLLSAEYIMSEGNEQVILCERGIRTFETHTRNTLDLSAIPVLRQLTHLPIIIDPSHATGKAALVPSMAMAAVAAGADGVMIEVHNDPASALCDGNQSLRPETFDALAKNMLAVHSLIRQQQAAI